MRYIGLDISKDTIDMQIMHTNTQFAHLQVANNAQGHQTIIDYLKALDAPVKACCEYTGIYYLGIATALHLANIPISVINPYQIKQFARMMLNKTKTDKQDAKLIARYAAYNPDLPIWQPPTPTMAACKAITARIEQLTKMLIMEKNRRYVTGDVIMASINRTILHLEDELARCKAALQNLIAQDDNLQELVSLAKSVPGVGDHVATVYLPILAEIERFPTAKHLVSYLGLSPITTESGTSVKGHRRISKMGNPYLRKTLYMPARAVCLRSRLFSGWFKERCEQGKHPKQLYVAMMRKMVVYLYKVITTKQPFNEKMVKSACG